MPDEIKGDVDELIMDFGNACFDCGDCDGTTETYDALFAAKTRAEGALREFLSSEKTAHQETRGKLNLSEEMLSALKYTVVVTIGGVDYEGFPTSEINYIQRLRILVEKESQLQETERKLKECQEELRQAKAQIAVGKYPFAGAVQYKVITKLEEQLAAVQEERAHLKTRADAQDEYLEAMQGELRRYTHGEWIPDLPEINSKLREQLAEKERQLADAITARDLNHEQWKLLKSELAEKERQLVAAITARDMNHEQWKLLKSEWAEQAKRIEEFYKDELATAKQLLSTPVKPEAPAKCICDIDGRTYRSDCPEHGGPTVHL